MADAEHLAILRQGAKAWQRWRREHPRIQLDLEEANLQRANLQVTDLQGANLQDANLENAQVTGTNFRGADLTNACIADWAPNSQTNLTDVRCEAIYLGWDEESDQPSDRRPHNPNATFAPGDFARLMEQARDTIDLIFSDGIDWRAFLSSFQNVQIEHLDGELGIQAIEKRRDGSFVIRVDAPASADKAAVEQLLKQEYERERRVLEAQYQAQLNAKDEQIEIYKQKSADMMKMAEWVANRPINVNANAEANAVAESESKGNITQSGNFGIGQMSGGSIQSGAKVAGVINEAQQKNLAEAAAEIQQLLNQLASTYPADDTMQQMAAAQEAVKRIEADPTLKERAIGAVRAGVLEGMKQTLAGKIVVAAIEGWAKPEE